MIPASGLCFTGAFNGNVSLPFSLGSLKRPVETLFRFPKTGRSFWETIRQRGQNDFGQFLLKALVLELWLKIQRKKNR